VSLVPPRGFCFGGCGGWAGREWDKGEDSGEGEADRGVGSIIRFEALGCGEWIIGYDLPDWWRQNGKDCVDVDVICIQAAIQSQLPMKDSDTGWLPGLNLHGGIASVVSSSWQRFFWLLQVRYRLVHIRRRHAGRIRGFFWLFPFPRCRLIEALRSKRTWVCEKCLTTKEVVKFADIA
jgi:hypothetical protein